MRGRRARLIPSLQLANSTCRLSLLVAVLVWGITWGASVDIGPVSLVTGGPSIGNADGNAATARFSYLPACIVDPNDGKLMVVDHNNNRLRKINVDGDKVTATYWGSGTAGSAVGTSTTSQFNYPRGLAFNGQGTRLFVSNSMGHTIARITISSGLLDIWAGTGSAGTNEGFGTTAQLWTPADLYYHPSTNDLFVAEMNGGRVRKFTSAGFSSTLAGNPNNRVPQDGIGTNAHFHIPLGLDYDAAVNSALWVLDDDSARLVTLTGVVTTVVGDPNNGGTTDGIGTAARLNSPNVIRILYGYAYVAESTGRSIRRIDLTTFAVDTVVNAAHASTFALNAVSYLMTSNTGLLGICSGTRSRMFFTSYSAVFQIVVGSRTTATATPNTTCSLSQEESATSSPSELKSFSESLTDVSRTYSESLTPTTRNSASLSFESASRSPSASVVTATDSTTMTTPSESSSPTDGITVSSTFGSQTSTYSATFVDYGIVEVKLLQGGAGVVPVDPNAGVRAGQIIHAQLSLRRLPQQGHTATFLPIVSPIHCLTPLSRNISFTALNVTLVGNQLFSVEVGCEVVALGFRPWWSPSPSGLDNYTATSTLLRILPRYNVTMGNANSSWREDSNRLTVGVPVLTFVVVEAAPRTGTELVVAFSVLSPQCLGIAPLELRFNSSSDLNQSVTILPLKRGVNVNVTVSLSGSAASSYAFHPRGWFTVNNRGPVTPTDSRTVSRSVTPSPAMQSTSNLPIDSTSSDTSTFSEPISTESRSLELPIPILRSASRKPLAFQISTLLEQTSAEDSRTLTLMIQDDTFTPEIQSLGTNRSTSPTPGSESSNSISSHSVGTEALSQCFSASATAGALMVHYNTMLIFSVTGSNTFNITSKPLREVMATNALYYFRSDEFLTLSIAPRCLMRNVNVRPAQIRFVPLVPAPVRSNSKERAVPASVAVRSVALAMGAGGLAVQTQRAMVMFGMVSCQPQFNESLSFLDNPFQVSIGPTSYGQLVAAMTLNQLLIFGIPLLHVALAVTRSHLCSSSIAHAFVWARFPSLSILPLMNLGSSTVMAATTISIYSPEPWHRPVAVVSLLLSFLPVGFLLWYLLRGWGATLIPGVNPLSRAGRARRRRAETESDPKRIINGTEKTVGDAVSLRRKASVYVEAFQYFMDGGVTWRDRDEKFNGYCRANQILFEDYTEQCYWFGVVEIGLAQFSGLLMGIKLGNGQCVATLFVLITVLTGLLIFVLWKRPYNAPLASVFSVVTTFLQLVGACFLAGWMLGATDSYRDWAETISLVGLYLVVGKAVLDAIPAICGAVIVLLDKIRGPATTRMTQSEQATQDESLQLTNQDLHATDSSRVHVHLDLTSAQEETEGSWDDFFGVRGVQDDTPLLLGSAARLDNVVSQPQRPVISHLSSNPNPLNSSRKEVLQSWPGLGEEVGECRGSLSSQRLEQALDDLL